MIEEELNEADRKTKEKNANKESIYHIVTNNDGIPSTPTIYRWIKERNLPRHGWIFLALKHVRRGQATKRNYVKGELSIRCS